MLKERQLTPGAMRLLVGLLRNNRDVLEIDLGATGLGKEGALALIETLGAANSPVTGINLPYNPQIDEAGQAALVAAVEAKGLKIALHF